MAQTIPERDEGVDRLEAFLGLVAGTRDALAGLQSDLDAEAEALTGQVGLADARLSELDRAAAALIEACGAAQREATAELVALAQAAGALHDERLGEARSRLAEADQAVTRGSAVAREELDRVATAIDEELARGEAALGEIEDAQTGWDARSEVEAAELAGQAERDAGRLAAADDDLQAALESVGGYVVDGLGGYTVASFDTLSTHLTNEALPAVADTLADLSRSALRALEDFDAAVEDGVRSLADGSEHELGAAASELDRLREECLARAEETHDEASRPFLEEAERCHEAFGKGRQAAAALQPLLPQLAAARDVAERVQELMDAFNPFG